MAHSFNPQSFDCVALPARFPKSPDVTVLTVIPHNLDIRQIPALGVSLFYTDRQPTDDRERRNARSLKEFRRFASLQAMPDAAGFGERIPMPTVVSIVAAINNRQFPPIAAWANQSDHQ
jgi:hypothetical protein